MCPLPKARQQPIARRGRRLVVSVPNLEQKPKILEALLEPNSDSLAGEDEDGDFGSSAPLKVMASSSSRGDKENESCVNKSLDLTDEQMLIVSGILFGYSLREATWGRPNTLAMALLKHV